MESDPRQITQLLKQWGSDQERVREALMPMVYEHLRRIAARQFASESGGHTLQPTALVNEAFLQLERWEEAAADADVAIESDPCFVKAYVRKARASRGLEQWEEAASALRDALEVSPGNKSVLALLEEEHVRKLVREGGLVQILSSALFEDLEWIDDFDTRAGSPQWELHRCRSPRTFEAARQGDINVIALLVVGTLLYFIAARQKPEYPLDEA